MNVTVTPSKAEPARWDVRVDGAKCASTYTLAKAKGAAEHVHLILARWQSAADEADAVVRAIETAERTLFAEGETS